jgi:spore maturation protein SpmB
MMLLNEILLIHGPDSLIGKISSIIAGSTDTTIYVGWVSARVNVRKEPNTDSKILDILEFNEEVKYQLHNNKWIKIFV